MTSLHQDAPRQLQAILDLHGISAATSDELTSDQRVTILNALYRILDVLDTKTNSTLTVNVIILTAQVFIASSPLQATDMPIWAKAMLFLLVLVPLVSTVRALRVFHVQGGSFLRWRGAGCTLVFPSWPGGSATPRSEAEAMWDEFKALADTCDERCSAHEQVRFWTRTSGIVLLITILAVVAQILYVGYVRAVPPTAPSVQAAPDSEITQADRDLLQRARDVAARAYAPYSRFGVGAAARTRSGAIYAGANMENASYGLTLCAETSALLQSVAAGDFAIEAIAIVGGPLNGNIPPGRAITPCGRCRQLILEAAQVANTDVRVISANADLSRISVRRISELLPDGFGPTDLG
jgi:cytidine deaminase